MSEKIIKSNYHNFSLTNKSSELLDALILGLKDKLPPEKRFYNKTDNASIIYNLFRGDYKFSHKQYVEIFNALTK